MNEKLKAACERAMARIILPGNSETCMLTYAQIIESELSPLFAEMEDRIQLLELANKNANAMIGANTEELQAIIAKERTARESAEARVKELGDWIMSFAVKCGHSSVQSSPPESAIEAKFESLEKACAEMRDLLQAPFKHWNSWGPHAKQHFSNVPHDWYGSVKALSQTAGQSYIHRSELERVQKELELTGKALERTILERDDFAANHSAVQKVARELKDRLENLYGDCCANDFNEHWESYTDAESTLKSAKEVGI